MNRFILLGVGIGALWLLTRNNSNRNNSNVGGIDYSRLNAYSVTVGQLVPVGYSGQRVGGGIGAG